MYWYIQGLTCQIPERLLDAADGGVMGMPLVFLIESAVEVLDLEHVPTNKRGLKFVDPLDDACIPAPVRCFSDSGSSVVGVDYDENPVAALGYLNSFSLYICNFHFRILLPANL